MRKLSPAEMAQIAGRAGRHVKDGTFGVTDGCRVLEPEVIEAIEQHRFTPLRSFYWRNRDLNFGSIDMLIVSLEAPPHLPFYFARGTRLIIKPDCACWSKEVRAAVQGAGDVRLLWEVASIPDFRQSLHESHYDLLAGIYMALVSNGVLAKERWHVRSNSLIGLMVI